MIWSGLIGNYKENILKSKDFNLVKPYVYAIVRKEDGLKYVGSRYGNVRLGVSPEDDLGVKYFTSGSLSKEFKKNPNSFDIKLIHTFDESLEALQWEERFVKKVMGKDGWANVGWANNFYQIDDVGDRISKSLNRITDNGKTVAQNRGEKVKHFAWNTEEGSEWRKGISERKREYWENISEEENKAVQEKRLSKLDFEDISLKRVETMRQDICENGLDGYQRSAAKGAETRRLKGIDSTSAKKRNELYNKKLCLMSEEEFEEFCIGKTKSTISGAITRRKRYSHLYVTNTD